MATTTRPASVERPITADSYRRGRSVDVPPKRSTEMRGAPSGDDHLSIDPVGPSNRPLTRTPEGDADWRLEEVPNGTVPGLYI